MTKQQFLIRSISIAAVFFSVLLLCIFYGPSRRRFASPPVVRNIAEYVEIYRLWEQERLKGRILYLFDRRAFRSDKGDIATNDNYLDLAVKRGIVRHVFHIVPTAAWQDVQKTLREDKRFSYRNGVFILPMEEGRLYVTTIEGITPSQEPALVVVNTNVWNEAEKRLIQEVLDKGVIKSDLVTYREKPASEAD